MDILGLNMRPRTAILWRILIIALLVIFAAANSASIARAKATVLFENYTAELNNLEVSINCEPDYGYENVILNGTINVLFYTIENASGGFLYRSKINGMNVTGIGQTTGAIYHVTMIGMGTSTLSDRSGYMSVNVANLIGKGNNVKAILTTVFHVNIDADGNERIVVDQFSAACH